MHRDTRDIHAPVASVADAATAATVVQFIIDHEETASIQDVAAWFHLEEEDVVAALRYYAAHGDRLHASGQVVRP